MHKGENKMTNDFKVGDTVYTRQQALEALKERRKRFLKDYPNDWKRIIKELNKLLEESASI